MVRILEPRLSSSTCAATSCSRGRAFAVGELWYASFRSSHRRITRPFVSDSACKSLLAARSRRACLRTSRAVSSSRRTQARFWTASSLSRRASSTSHWTELSVSSAWRTLFSELSPSVTELKKCPSHALQSLHASGLWRMTRSSLLKVQGPGSGSFGDLLLCHWSRRRSTSKDEAVVIRAAALSRFRKFLGVVGSFVSRRCVRFVLAMNEKTEMDGDRHFTASWFPTNAR